MSTKVHESPKETCFRHHCSRSHLYNLAGAGKIIMRKNGRRTLVDVASADAYFNNLPEAKIKAPASRHGAAPTAPAPRGRGRSPKQSTSPYSIPDVGAPPVQPEALPPSSPVER
jgi:hypothetical protein